MSKIYLLNNLPFEGVENLEVFKIEYISSKIDLNAYDALVFTSKNAIYSLDSFNKEWKNIDSYAIAVNEEYAVEHLVLKENDVVAIIPPVSGG